MSHNVKTGSSQCNVAWETLTSLLQYRSALNGLTPPINIENANVPKTLTTVCDNYTRIGLQAPKITWVGLVPKDQAAVMDLIGQGKNQNLTIGNAFLLAQGKSMQLDKMRLKNVVFNNVHVIHEGGPVVLENLYFLNCSFDIKQTANKQTLSARLMEPAPTNHTLPRS